MSPVPSPRQLAWHELEFYGFLHLTVNIEAVGLDQWQNGQWTEFATATSIGNCRLIRGPRIRTSRVRLRVMQAAVCPAISEVGLFAEP